MQDSVYATFKFGFFVVEATRIFAGLCAGAVFRSVTLNGLFEEERERLRARNWSYIVLNINRDPER